MNDYPEAWPADFQDYVFLGRVVSRLGHEATWRGLCTGELVTAGSSRERADFLPVPLSPMRFSNQSELKEQVLHNCTIDAMDQQAIRHRIVRRHVPVPHWIYVTRASLDQFEKTLGPKTTSSQHDEQKAKPGPRPDFEWEKIKTKCDELMDDNGDFTPDDPEWDCQARLEAELMTFCQHVWRRQPAPSTLRERLPEWLSAWRKRKTGEA